MVAAVLHHRRADLSIQPKSERFKSFLAEKKASKYDRRPSLSGGKQSSLTSLDAVSAAKSLKEAEAREATEQALKEIMPFTSEDRKAFMVKLASKLSYSSACVEESRDDVSIQEEEGVIGVVKTRVAAIEEIVSGLIVRNRNKADARDCAEDDATMRVIEEATSGVLSEKSPAYQESIHSNQSRLSVSQRLAKALRYTQFKAQRRTSIGSVTASPSTQSTRSSIGFITASQSTSRISNGNIRDRDDLVASIGHKHAPGERKKRVVRGPSDRLLALYNMGVKKLRDRHNIVTRRAKLRYREVTYLSNSDRSQCNLDWYERLFNLSKERNEMGSKRRMEIAQRNYCLVDDPYFRRFRMRIRSEFNVTGHGDYILAKNEITHANEISFSLSRDSTNSDDSKYVLRSEADAMNTYFERKEAVIRNIDDYIVYSESADSALSEDSQDYNVGNFGSMCSRDSDYSDESSHLPQISSSFDSNISDSPESCDREDGDEFYQYSIFTRDDKRLSLLELSYTSQSAYVGISSESMDWGATKVQERKTPSELSRDAYIYMKESDSSDSIAYEQERSTHETLNDLTACISQSVNDSFSSTSMGFQGNEVPGKRVIPECVGELSSDAYNEYISQSLLDSFSSAYMGFNSSKVLGKRVIPGSLGELSGDAYNEYISQSLLTSFTSLSMDCPANKKPEMMKYHRTDDEVTPKEVETPNTHTPKDTKTYSLKNSSTTFQPNLIKIQCIVEGEFEMLLLTSASSAWLRQPLHTNES